MLTIDTIGTKTILQFPNKKYFQPTGDVIGDCLRIGDNIDSTPNTATIFVLKAAARLAGEVLNIRVTMRDLLAPFSLPHFQQETGFLSVVAGGEVLLSLIGAGTSGLCQMLLAPSLTAPALPAFVTRYQIFRCRQQTASLDYTQGGKNFRKFRELCE